MPDLIHDSPPDLSTAAHEPATGQPSRPDGRDRAGGRLLGPDFWPGVSIVAMWLAVLFDGIFGGMMTFASPSTPNVTTIPSAVLVALFAAIGTISVAKRGFARRGKPE
jgi:hypothetical protein